jgi:60 kDa SS-A/Ro ribonucleoprotein
MSIAAMGGTIRGKAHRDRDGLDIGRRSFKSASTISRRNQLAERRMSRINRQPASLFLRPTLPQIVIAVPDHFRTDTPRHPVAILIDLRTYAAGHGERGQHTWTPEPQVIDALDSAFYSAFGGVTPTGNRWLLAIDVSGSMSTPVAGTAMSCCEGATAMALVTAHVEEHCTVCAFSDGLRPLPITRPSRLNDALRHTLDVNFGGTDCSLPMLYALDRRLAVDAFVVLTDSETWAGAIHPVQALRRDRERMGIPARLIVVGMVSNGFTIADPGDAGMMDVVGFDTAVPQLMADFMSA